MNQYAGDNYIQFIIPDVDTRNTSLDYFVVENICVGLQRE